MTAAPASDLALRWEPSFVRRIIRLRVVSAAVLGLVSMALPVLGPNRFLVGALLFGPVALGSLIVARRLPSERVLSVVTVIDMAWCAVIAHLMPEAFGATIIVSVALLGFVANEDRTSLIWASVIGAAGFTSAGVTRDIEQWDLLVITYLVLLPVSFFVAQTQREREARHGRQIVERVEQDPLTGLLNRTGLARALEQESLDAVIVLDLDGFKDINDTLGHDAGDELLVLLADRMRRAVGTGGVLARSGGDEFSVLVHGGDANTIAREILTACRHRIALGDVDVSVGASIGIAMQAPGVDAGELIRRADFAMYEAKRTHSGVRRWSGQTGSVSRLRISLSGDVERGFERDEFELYFQPIVELESERVVDVEGLLRWNHPEHGLLMPDEFIELIEGIGRRSNMDRLVFAHACALAARLQPVNVGVSVNVSAGSLLRSSVPQVLAEELRRHDVVAQRLTVEIVEDELIGDQATARAVLGALGDLGVGIAIDDFGTGHSSLSRLRHLPVTSLKIDQAFARSMRESADDHAIVNAVSRLGRALDLIVVAEGIEDLELRDHLLDQEIPVDRVQGYGIAMPMPADDVVKWISARESAREYAEDQARRRTR